MHSAGENESEGERQRLNVCVLTCRRRGSHNFLDVMRNELDDQMDLLETTISKGVVISHDI